MYLRSLAFIFLIIQPLVAGAEFLCRAQISYKWTPHVEKNQTPEPELEVHIATIETRAEDEQATKKKLEQVSLRERARAADICEKEHQDVTTCIAGKFSSLGSTLNNLTFTARATLEKSITADCSRKLGKCGETKATEPECSAIVAPSTTPEAAEGGKDAKAGGKKK